MIECSICHVRNNEDARFCAECGHRLSGPSSASQPEAPAASSPQAAQRPLGQRLHSPLLANAGTDAPTEPSNSASGEVDRLRRMNQRPKDERVNQMPDNQYKNPYDPRNNMPQGQAATADKPAADGDSHKIKLRSPLLAAEEGFDEEEEYIPEEPASSGGLRSPLLGGGGGGRPTAFQYERRARVQPDADGNPAYPGPERRSGLRSPILSGAHEEQYWEEDNVDETPVDEDDPNVLRSPLLAARRPVSSAPPAKPAPTSYMNLQGANQASGIPSMVPPMPAGAQAPAMPAQPMPAAQAPMQRPQAPQAQPNMQAPPTAQSSAPPFTSPSTKNAANDEQMPSVVPPTFQNVQSPLHKHPFLTQSQESTYDPIPLMPEKPTAAKPEQQTISGSKFNGPKQESQLASKFDRSNALDDYDQPRRSPINDRYADNAQPSSAMPMLIGGLAVLLLLGKLYVLSAFFGTQWRETTFLVVDQVVGLVTIICLIMLCFFQAKK